MFRQRGEEYVDPSQAKVEEAIQRKIREQAERHYKGRETKEVNGSKFQIIVGCVVPIVIWLEFHLRQYSDDHREDDNPLYRTFHACLNHSEGICRPYIGC